MVSSIPKNKEPKLDKKDKRILTELFINARLPLVSIGKKVGLSKQVVDYRLKNLKKKSIIDKYTVLIDISKLGFDIHELRIDLKTITTKKESELTNYFVEHPFVRSVLTCTGTWDLIIVFCSKDIKHFNKLIMDFINKAGDLLLRYTVDRLFSEKILPYEYLIESKIGIYDSIKISDVVKYDQLDLSILKKLESNSRMHLLDLSKNINLTPEAVKYRLKKLLKKGMIVRYYPKINISTFDYEWYYVFIYLKNKKVSIERTLQEFLMNKLNVIRMKNFTGLKTICFDIHVRTSRELMLLLNELRDNYSNIILDIQSVLILEELKYTHLPKGLTSNL